MIYSKEVKNTCIVKCGVSHGYVPIPKGGKWVYSEEIKGISGLTHGIGWCTPQQGAYKLILNVKEGIIGEVLTETTGCSGMTHSAAVTGEVIVGKTLLGAVDTDSVCDVINIAMRGLFLQIVHRRARSVFSENGLPVGAGLEDLDKGTCSQVGTAYSAKAKGPCYLDLVEGYILKTGLDENGKTIGYEYVSMGVFVDVAKKDVNAEEALNNAKKMYGRYVDAIKYIDPRHE